MRDDVAREYLTTMDDSLRYAAGDAAWAAGAARAAEIKWQTERFKQMCEVQ